MNKTILLVDDDDMFRAIIRRHLESLGYAVVELKSGEGVTAYIKVHAPVACLIDLIMDGKEGVETILEVLKQPQRPKIIAVSGKEEYLDLVRPFGIDAALSKPVPLSRLQQTLDRVLGVAAV